MARSLKIRWTGVARLGGVVLASVAALTVLAGATSPAEPAPLPPDVGLGGIAAAPVPEPANATRGGSNRASPTGGDPPRRRLGRRRAPQTPPTPKPRDDRPRGRERGAGLAPAPAPPAAVSPAAPARSQPPAPAAPARTAPREFGFER